MERATQFAIQGCQLDADHVFRRLAVCALEDVGIGNLLAVADCLAVLGDRMRRREAGEVDLAAYLAQQLAESPKSRLACDLLSLVEYNLGLEPLIADWVKATDYDLAQRASDEALPIEQKMLATWLLAGTHRFQSGVLPKSNYRPRAPLMEQMAKARMPLILYYIADRGAARTSDALFCSYLQIWRLLKGDCEFALLQNEIPPSEMIGNFPAEAYDMHTREGKMAIKLFQVYLFESLGRQHSGGRKPDIGNVIFRAEGGLLDRDTMNETSRKIAKYAQGLEVFGDASFGDRSFGESVIQTPILNKIRRKIAVRSV